MEGSKSTQAGNSPEDNSELACIRRQVGCPPPGLVWHFLGRGG